MKVVRQLFKRLPYILIYLIGFVLIGAASIITQDIGFAGFQEPSVYVDMILTYAAIICIIIATMLNVIDNFKNSDTEYLETDQAIKKFAKESYVPSVFSKYCDHTNETRKIKQYVLNIKMKIYRLEKRASEQDMAIWIKGTKEEKEANKYCVRRLTLEQQLTDKYIKENIATTKVNYDKITAHVILGGNYSKEDMKWANDFVTKNKSGKIAKRFVPKLLFSFGMTTLASTIILGEVVFNTSMILSVIVKSFTLVFQAFMTVRFAKDWNQDVVLKDIRFRKGILKEYNNWVTQEVKRQEAAKAANKKDPKSIANSIEIRNPISDDAALKIQDDLGTANIETEEVQT